ncbi:hypothetical protein AA23498_2620 [Acetobacter nitrogenifigens DSM 23921 = NBRC 105050]|nr:hypothetical protein AA23498_2620 [Acetobacter nitrogenifigens DSM 23921 = NBRC 105050]
MMERSQILGAMSELKLYGMKAAYDELVSNAVKRQHVPQQVIADLVCAEISEKHTRSVRYQMTIARMPLARDIEDFRFDGTPVNETLIRGLGAANFLIIGVMLFWSAAQELARRIWRRLLDGHASGRESGVAFSILSIWSTGLRPIAVPVRRVAWRSISDVWIS